MLVIHSSLNQRIWPGLREAGKCVKLFLIRSQWQRTQFPAWNMKSRWKIDSSTTRCLLLWSSKVLHKQQQNSWQPSLWQGQLIQVRERANDRDTFLVIPSMVIYTNRWSHHSFTLYPFGQSFAFRVSRHATMLSLCLVDACPDRLFCLMWVSNSSHSKEEVFTSALHSGSWCQFWFL